ncbi:MAG: hypothetical protein U5L72_16380 [Bacteroidales bacterium]|nr:hypothetical protein [Bacteroidales bacterium]
MYEETYCNSSDGVDPVNTITFLETLKGEFAIIADSKSLNDAGNEINEYAAALQSEGLAAVVIEDRWQHPDSIRQLLRTMHANNKGFEGAVFIGDIPVLYAA